MSGPNSDLQAERTLIPRKLTEAEIHYTGAGTKGGASTVYALFGYNDRYVYKKYREPRDPADLDRLVKMNAAMDPASMKYAYEHTAWPVATVRDSDDRAVGLVLVRAEMSFHAHLSTAKVRVRDFNYLLYEKRAARVGIPPATIRQKAALLENLVSVLQWLDSRGLVHEDLAAHNLLWRLEPEPKVFLLDCDSLRLVDQPTDQPLYSTVDWTDPRVLSGETARPDRASTSYVIGLLVARILGSPYWRPTPGGDLTSPGSDFPQSLMKPLRAAMGPAADRPTLESWRSTIARAAKTLPDVSTVAMPLEARPMLMRVEGQTIGLYDRLAMFAGLVLGALAAILVLSRFL